MALTSATKLLKVRKFREIPGPPRIPFWGNLYLYKLGICKKEDYREELLKMARKYGPLVREDIGPNNTIIHLFDPADVKTVFANEGTMPVVEPLQETTQLYRKLKNTSPGLGNTNGEEWYKLRNAVRKVMLRPKEVQRYLQDVNKISDEFVKKLDELRHKETGEIDDLRLEIGKWSREVSGWVCFGERLDCFDKTERESTQMIKLNKKIFELSSELKFSLPIYKYIPTPKWKELVKIEEIVHECVVDLMKAAIKSNSKNSSSFISYLLSQKELSEKDVQILILSVFGDGLSTTVPSLIYNLYCLSVNPKVQKELREEIRAATEGGKNCVTPEAISNNLQLMKAVVKESFRMYPIGTEISRVLQKDLILSNYHVPKGTHVHLNQIVHYKSNEYFDKPNEFKPERWLRDGTNEINPLLLVPFGHGTRTCAGRRFAEQDLYVLLSKILLNFELGYPEKASPLQQIYQILLFPKEPVRIQFKPLTK